MRAYINQISKQKSENNLQAFQIAITQAASFIESVDALLNCSSSCKTFSDEVRMCFIWKTAFKIISTLWQSNLALTAVYIFINLHFTFYFMFLQAN